MSLGKKKIVTPLAPLTGAYRKKQISFVVIVLLFLGLSTASTYAQINFQKSTLTGTNLNRPTSLQFGPDGRLYVAQIEGEITAYTVTRTASNSYEVSTAETIDLIKQIPNHNDDGTTTGVPTNERLVTGLFVAGTAANPVIYVTSSDPRNASNGEGNTDTNSGVLSRLQWNGTQWTKLDLVRGLPRSRELHVSNGLYHEAGSNTLYIAQGGHTNMGAPSASFDLLPEYALSASILSVDLNAIGESTYDLPTLDDPSRSNTGGKIEAEDVNDPFGGNAGANQAILVPEGPVQIFASGFRNAYDILRSQAGRFYTIDNGPNGGWGGVPVNEGPGGTCTNDASTASNNTYQDNLHLISAGYYGGHPNPTRGNIANTFNGQSPISSANAVECDYRIPGSENGALTTWDASTNGFTEYTASNFNNALQGNLLAASFDNSIQRVVLNGNGDTAIQTSSLFSNVGIVPLDVTALGDNASFPGTIWVADHIGSNVVVFEPADFGNTCGAFNDASKDEDADGYNNADEIDNLTDPCSAADIPSDYDLDFISNLNDDDDDDDGILDVNDPFALDANNGASTNLPVQYGWGPGDPGTGILGLGFTGLMINGTDNYETLYDATQMTPGGAAGILTVDQVTEGDAFSDFNTQEYGFQFGINVNTTSAPFTVHTRMVNPFAGGTPINYQSLGFFIGTGDQSNYLKMVINANGGNGGIEVGLEQNDAFVGNNYGVGVLGNGNVDLYLSVNPATQEVQPRFAVGGGAIQDLGDPISIPASWLSGSTKLAVGILSTAIFSNATFAASWDLIEVTEDQTVTPTAAAFFEIDPPGSIASSSTFQNGAFTVRNDATGGLNIEQVRIDLSSAMLPDMVFDPNGQAGDVVAKCFEANSDTGLVGLQTSDGACGNPPFATPRDNGFDVLALSFNDFGPGETFSFSVDVDPTSIQGHPGTNDLGSVSGLELTGATVTVIFDNGTSLVGETFHKQGSATGSSVVLKESGPAKATALAQPTLAVLGLPGPTAQVTEASQTIRISGPTGASVALFILEAGLFTDQVPNGGFDLDAFEANNALGFTDLTGTIGGGGTVDMPITLTKSDAKGGFNYIAAVVTDSNGQTSLLSNVWVLELTSGSGNTFEQAIQAGWNLIGLPLEVSDNNYLSVYPNVVPNTFFRFAGSYVAEENLSTGVGYWAQFGSSETQTVSGTPITSVNLNLQAGWNLIAGPSCSVPAASISDPSNIIVPNTLFGFSGSYTAATQVEQGRSYWIQANSAGTIGLSCATAIAKQTLTQATPDGFGVLNISDTDNHTQTLYFGGVLDRGQAQSYSAPPRPPIGAFDVRFEGDHRLVVTDEALIQIQAQHYPIQIEIPVLPTASDDVYVIESLVGQDAQDAQILFAGQMLYVTDPSVKTLRLRVHSALETDLPDTFVLEQNYPNPFNPSTQIGYYLPQETDVRVEVFNLYGQKIADLFSGVQAAGRHQVQWDGRDQTGTQVSSGMYVYRLQTERFTQTKKMVLLK